MHWPRAVATALAPAALPAAAQAEQQERELRTLVNAERAGHGLAELRHSPALARSAQGHARRLLRRGVLAHATSSAGPPRFRALGENLALVGGRSPQPGNALRLWMTSAVHGA